MPFHPWPGEDCCLYEVRDFESERPLFLQIPRVSFTKLCDALYDQSTRFKSHALILLTNCYIALGYVALPYIALHYAACRELRWYTRTGCLNLTYEHLCERQPRSNCSKWCVTSLDVVFMLSQSTKEILLKQLSHKVKMQYVQFKLHTNYFLLPWKNPEEISNRSVFFKTKGSICHI